MDVKFEPCGHALMCHNCADRAKKCPTCKARTVCFCSVKATLTARAIKGDMRSLNIIPHMYAVCALSCESVDITIVAWHAILFIVHAQRGVQVNYICECHLRALHYSEQVQERALLLHILRYGDNARENSKIGPLR